MAINTKMMKLWETSITFFSCTCGYMLGLPMATEVCEFFISYLLRINFFDKFIVFLFVCKNMIKQILRNNY